MDERRIQAMAATLERIKASRPKMANRITTAEHILVVQASVSNHVRPIKVRRRACGSHEYLIKSNTKLRTVYTVDPATWGCDCKWQQKGNTGCSHSIAAYVMECIAG